MKYFLTSLFLCGVLVVPAHGRASSVRANPSVRANTHYHHHHYPILQVYVIRKVIKVRPVVRPRARNVFKYDYSDIPDYMRNPKPPKPFVPSNINNPYYAR